ncbi:MAG: phosphoenolpyruvate carboxylase, partial [Novosphingobium sp.]
MNLLPELDARLSELHARTTETPLFNPVFQLSLELSRRIESGELTLDKLADLVAELECDGLLARAHRLNRLVAPIARSENLSRLSNLADAADFESFAARWQHPAAHIVFTAHPTFLLTGSQSEAVASAASSGEIGAATACVAPHQRDAITLDSEHRAAMDAIARAQTARDAINRTLFAQARQRWPDQWRSLAPLPLRFAHWVGYDMDGRTDISWATSLRYRLEEKAERLASYAAALTNAAPEIAELLQAASSYAQAQAERLAATDITDPVALSVCANALTADHPFKLTSLSATITRLQGLAATADDATAETLLTIAAAMRADGLGMGWIHFRVNASQLQNAIRRRIDPSGKLDLASQAALVRMRELLAEAQPLRSNFAALAIETSTAIRQFLAMAQILSHVDADAPIRMLVAECEQPTTVLAALYFAKLFGIADKVDVSPLFETESALEHGGRFLDALLAEAAYRDYARKRGRVSVQTGFSDAGRFVGQIPAALAIERLQGRLSEAMAANGLTNVAALIFNTHGE